MEAVQADCTGRQLRGSTRLLQAPVRLSIAGAISPSSAAPASVNDTLRVVRWSSRMPSRSSRAADQLAQRRGRYPQLLGRPAETPLLGYGCKGAQGTELARMDHGVHLSIVKLAL